ncbi:hypothetical protein HispidOSU_008609, partial [Sigmodon hispidus]
EVVEDVQYDAYYSLKFMSKGQCDQALFLRAIHTTRMSQLPIKGVNVKFILH